MNTKFKNIKIGVVGAQGLVGKKILGLLTNEYIVENAELILFVSPRSIGKKIKVGNQFYKGQALTRENLETIRPDFVLFAAGGKISEAFAPIVAEIGGIAIDNSSVFRMVGNVPLIVPEVNFDEITHIKQELEKPIENRKGIIIANPNCSTIQSVAALKPLDDAFNVRRVIYSTYQAVSGSGKDGIGDFHRTRKGEKNEFYPYPIYNNLIPHIDSFLESGYTKEEQKMIDETRKILCKPNLAVTATTVRVPILNCHSVAMNIEFENNIEIEDVMEVLYKAQEDNRGIIVFDNQKNDMYPMPIIVDDTDDVYIGRIRIDEGQPNTINLFCVADNLRKGAATNAVQILYYLI